MAINPESAFPGKITASSVEYPFGEARNITAPGDGTGTPWDQLILNDIFGFQQALLSSAGFVPSGSPDKVGTSQYLNAMLKIGALTFDTIALMTAALKADLSPDQQAFTRGFNVVGDEGGGPFYFDSASSETDIQGFIISTDEGGAGRWKRIVDYGLSFKQLGAKFDGTDDTGALTAASAIGGRIKLNKGTMRITAGDVDILNPIMIIGEGMGISNIELHAISNPVSAKFIMKLLDQNNVFFKDMTFTCTAKAQGIFDLGTLTGGVYGPDQLGNLNVMRVSQCDDMTFENVEVTGFSGEQGVLFTNEDNVAIFNNRPNFINCHNSFNRGTGFSLQATKDALVLGGSGTDNGLQVFDSVDAQGNPTSTTRTATNFIDGGVGYGIVLGRTATSTKLKSIGVRCIGFQSARNVRHGIDCHGGAGIYVSDHVSEDDLLSGYNGQEIGGSLNDAEVGDFTYTNFSIRHTVYAENRGPLFDDSSIGVERPDSNPVNIANISGRIKNVKIGMGIISGWRFRQISAYSATDTIQPIAASAVNKVVIDGVDILADNADFYPAKLIQASADLVVITNNTAKYGLRGTFDRAAMRFNSAGGHSVISNNSIEEINVFSTGTNQVARPLFEKTNASDEVSFTGNNMTRSTQGVRGSLWETTAGNAQTGHVGFLGTNQGNTLDGVEYASLVEGDRTFHITAAGAGNQDGSTVGDAFSSNNITNLQLILNQLPACTGALTLSFSDDIDFGTGTGIVIPDHFRRTFFDGDPSQSTAAATKTAKLRTTGNNFITCPEQALMHFRFLEVDGGAVALKFNDKFEVQACAIACNSTSSGQVAISASQATGKVQLTDISNCNVAIQGLEASAILSIANQTTGTAPTNALNANSSAIYKNGTQPGGAELTQNGGTIA